MRPRAWVCTTTALLRGCPPNRHTAAATSMAGAGVVYIGQLILIATVVLALRGVDWLDGRAFALSAIAQTLVMQVGQVVGYVRSRHEINPGSLERGATS